MNDSVTVLPLPNYSEADRNVIEGLRFAEAIRNLDERSAMKIALALAGTNPTLFKQLLEVTRTQNIVPPSTLTGKLNPTPSIVEDKKAHREQLEKVVNEVNGTSG